MEEFKKIRVDYFHYRIRKGRVDILLQQAETLEKYEIPYHYVTKDESVHMSDFLEDEGDFVILDAKLNESHLSRAGRCWVPLSGIQEIPFLCDNKADVVRRCLAVFLDLCPPEETFLHSTIENMLDDLLINEAKEEYRKELAKMLDRKITTVITLDAYTSSPNRDLLEEEIRTLKHFVLVKPKSHVEYRHLKYHYKPVDWKALGSKVTFLENALK
jgi:hypothetical protein